MYNPRKITKVNSEDTGKKGSGPVGYAGTNPRVWSRLRRERTSVGTLNGGYLC
jgi:hypothetical protein